MPDRLSMPSDYSKVKFIKKTGFAFLVPSDTFCHRKKLFSHSVKAGSADSAMGKKNCWKKICGKKSCPHSRQIKLARKKLLEKDMWKKLPGIPESLG